MTWYAPTGAVVKRVSPRPSPKGPTRAQLIQRAEQSHGSISTQIANHFTLFENPQPGTFGNGADSFQISRPKIWSLPNYVLDTTSGPGNPMVARQTRELTTASGARIWILAARTICMFGPPGERVGACSGNGLATKTRMDAQHNSPRPNAPPRRCCP